MSINLRFISGLVAATIFLTGCGGGGSSSSGGSDEFTSDEPIARSSLTSFIDPGAFYSQFEFGNGSSGQAVTLLSPSGRVVTLFGVNNISVSRIEMGEDGKFSDPATDIYYDQGWVQEEGVIQGQAVSRKVIQGTAESKAGDFRSSFRLEREDVLSDQGASLTYIDRTFFHQNSDTLSTTVTIAADGSVTGSDTTGCVIAGDVTIPDEQVNVYEVALELSRCGAASGTPADLRNGSFTGLGIYDRTTGELEFLITNGKVVGAFFGS